MKGPRDPAPRAGVPQRDRAMQPFFQSPPALAKAYTADCALVSYLRHALPHDVYRAVEPELLEMGALSAGPLFELQQKHRGSEPKLTAWDAWGRRIDRIDVTPVWHEAARIAAERGVVATAYERRHGAHARIHQFALAYLFHGSTEMYACPLAMTDGAARTLIVHRNRALIDRAVPQLTSRDPARAWTSGQWMTERVGGSDVSNSETVARKDGEHWRLFGTKGFTSAATSEVALTLARPQGNPSGGEGLALFYLEPRDDEGRLCHIFVNRLKDKLGTRMLPTAELTLDGVPAIPVVGLSSGINHIAPMLNVTRTWNAVLACAEMRRGLDLARGYAHRRVAFGAPLLHKPLHLDTLPGLEAEAFGALLLAFRVVELLGREEANLLEEEERSLLRLLTALAKLTTAKQAVAVASEVLEAFGGAGYVEDTGVPHLLRDAQVLPIWEGTTNVLSLDVVHVLSKLGGLSLVEREITRCLSHGAPSGCTRAARAAQSAVAHARAWFERGHTAGPAVLEAGARRFSLMLGRSLELALLVDHAARTDASDPRAAAAARRLGEHGVHLVSDDPLEADARILADR